MANDSKFVRWLQERLFQVGYDDVKQTGRNDPFTQEAIKDIQRTFGLRETGTATKEFIDQLRIMKPVSPGPVDVLNTQSRSPGGMPMPNMRPPPDVLNANPRPAGGPMPMPNRPPVPQMAMAPSPIPPMAGGERPPMPPPAGARPVPPPYPTNGGGLPPMPPPAGPVSSSGLQSPPILQRTDPMNFRQPTGPGGPPPEFLSPSGLGVVNRMSPEAKDMILQGIEQAARGSIEQWIQLRDRLRELAGIERNKLIPPTTPRERPPPAFAGAGGMTMQQLLQR